MIAESPGWGPLDKRTWVGGLFAYPIGLLAGGLAMGAALRLLGSLVPGALPLWPLAVVAVALALIAVRVIPIQLRGSLWRVPQSWYRFGAVSYALGFGVTMGTGVMTALSSPGYYLLLIWGLIAGGWATVLSVFAAFAVGRAAAFLVVALVAYRQDRSAGDLLDQADVLAGRLAPVEAAVLVALAVLWALG